MSAALAGALPWQTSFAVRIDKKPACNDDVRTQHSGSENHEGEVMSMTCGYCASEMPTASRSVSATCPGCGLIWEYGEGLRPTVGSIRAAIQRAVAAERVRCAKIALEFDGKSTWVTDEDGTKYEEVELDLSDLYELILNSK